MASILIISCVSCAEELLYVRTESTNPMRQLAEAFEATAILNECPNRCSKVNLDYQWKEELKL